MSFSIRTSNKLGAPHTSVSQSQTKPNTDFLSSDDYSFLDNSKKNAPKIEKPKNGACIHRTSIGGINPDFY